jgi:hypothetical protein
MLVALLRVVVVVVVAAVVSLRVTLGKVPQGTYLPAPQVPLGTD